MILNDLKDTSTPVIERKVFNLEPVAISFLNKLPVVFEVIPSFEFEVNITLGLPFSFLMDGI